MKNEILNESENMHLLGMFLQEIETYYKKSRNEQGSLLVLNRAMVAFALNHMHEKALDDLLIRLMDKGQLLSLDPERLVFRRFYLEPSYTEAYSTRKHVLTA